MSFSKNLSKTMRVLVDIAKELEESVDSGNHERIAAALDQGANPNIYHSSRRETLLMTACFNCDLTAVRQLLDAQADPNQGISDRPRGEQITPLMIAAECGMTEAVSELLNAKADPHTRNSNGETALLAAARTNNHDAFAVLVGSMVSTAT